MDTNRGLELTIPQNPAIIFAVSLSFTRLLSEIKLILRWFAPGLGVKRWLALLLAGITMLGVGLAMFLLDIYRTAPDTWWLPALSFLSLRFLARPLRVLIFGSLGLGLIGLGLWGLNRALLIPFLKPGMRLVDQVARYRLRERGPRVAVIGGGHGIATVLRGLKTHTHNLTAVVSVADDGGSSGEIRRELGILPPGDIRNCLAALSNDEALLTQLFQYRFGGNGTLGGHAFGNLFISALADITGSFEQAVTESRRVLSVYGQVLPATLHDVRLIADVQVNQMPGEVRVKGESKIPKAAGRVRRIWLEPNDAAAYPPTVQALLNADMIIIGPGSLYTSILPNLLVPDLRAAIRTSKAVKIYICNIVTQAGETEFYTCSDHVRAIEEQLGKGVLDILLCNENENSPMTINGVKWVEVDERIRKDSRLYLADLRDREAPWRHDAVRLAQTLMDLYNERTGPLSGS